MMVVFFVVKGDYRFPLLLALIGCGLFVAVLVVVGGRLVGYGIVLLLLGGELMVFDGEMLRVRGGGGGLMG
jgi:hypothetical protein